MDSNNNKLCLGHGSGVVKYLAYYELYKRKKCKLAILYFIVGFLDLCYKPRTNGSHYVSFFINFSGYSILSKKNILITLPHIAIVIASFVFILTCKGMRQETSKKRNNGYLIFLATVFLISYK